MSAFDGLGDLGADTADSTDLVSAVPQPPASSGVPMNTFEFLRGFWPAIGIYVIVTGPHTSKTPGRKPSYWHHVFHKMLEAAAFVMVQRDKINVYFALFSYRSLTERTNDKGQTYTTVERTQSNALCTRLFYMDLDVGPSTATVRKYPSREDALRALVSWIATTGLPKPTVVFSGNGVHVYWRMTDDVQRTAWQPIADKLKRLCEHYELLADPAVTADSSRILRPIHSLNHKDPTNPRKVELKRLAEPIELAAFAAAVEAASAGLPLLLNGMARPSATSGIILPESAATSAPETPANIANVENMLRAISPDVPRGQWLKVLWAAAALDWTCGEDLAREWSRPGSTFDEGEFSAAWGSFDPSRGTGPGSLVHVAREHGYMGPSLVAGGDGVSAAALGSLTGVGAAGGLPSTVDGASEADIANGERLAAAAGGRMLWVRESAEWLQFDPEAGWLSMPRDVVEGFAVQVVKAMRREAGERHDAAPHDPMTKAALQNSKRASARPHMLAMVDMAKAVPGVAALLADFDADPWHLGVRNGVLDLRLGELRPFAPELRVSKRAAVAFHPSADCPLWKGFLTRVLPDREVRAFLRHFAGYCLTGDVGAHKWVFLFGSGANGKSVFAETLAHLLGDYAHALATEALMDDPRGGRNHDPEILAMQGKRLAFATETEEGQRLASARVKRLTGGDTLSGRRPYGKAPESFKPSHKLMVSGNHRPAISDTSPGTWRRVAIVEFGVEIPEPERDPDLVKSLGTVTPVSRRIPTPWKTGPSLSTWGHRRDPRPERSAFALREAEGVGGACAPTWVSSEADLSFVF